MLKEIALQIQDKFPGIFKEIYSKYVEEQRLNEDIQLIDELASFVLLGGKRVRPLFLFLGSVNGEEIKIPQKENPFWNFAVGLELVHAGMLIHDDIMDSGKMRRGAECMHKKIGTDRAIILGDIAWSAGYDIMLRAGTDAEKKVEIIQQFLSAALMTGIGQDMDIMFRDKKNLTRSEIEELYKMKTAAYSFTAPLMMGALLQEDEELRGAFGPIGNLFGILYQLADDTRDHKKEISVLSKIDIDKDQWRTETMQCLQREIDEAPTSNMVKKMLREAVTLVYA